MKKSFIFVLLKATSQGRFYTSIFHTHNNITHNRKAVPATVSFLLWVFYCANILKYEPINLINPIYLPLTLVRDAIANNWLDSLIYFVWLRKCYQKPIIYNYTTRKVASLINASPTTVSHHMTILINKGLCERIGDHLHLKSTTKLKQQYKFLVPVAHNTNKQIQRDLLRAVVIKRNLHSQVRQFNQKNNHLQLLKAPNPNYAQVKKLKQLNKEHGANYKLVENSMVDCLTLSNASFGSLCNRSASVGTKIQKTLNQLNLITSHTRTLLVSSQRYTKKAFYALCLDGSHYLSKSGQIYQRLSNRIEFSNQAVSM